METTVLPTDIPPVAMPVERSNEGQYLLKDATGSPVRRSQTTGTAWLRGIFVQREVIEADREARSLAELAQEQREFLSSIREPLEYVELPPDD